MSSPESNPQKPRSAEHDATERNRPHIGFWIRELPFSIVLILTILGVAYTSFLKQPIMGYWELLAPLIGLVAVGSGWLNANDKNARFRLICTQALHWTAFLIVMNIIMLPSVQRILDANAIGLAVLMLLALGTFTAGVHVFSWQVCLLGLVMAVCVPAAAWIQASALIVLLVAVAVLGVGAVLWWYWHESRFTRA
jgi:hypothetical protein